MSKTKKIISLILMVVLVMTMATVAIVSSSALEDGEIHVVAGADGLCGSAWDPTDTNNQMTWNADKGIYEIVYTNVAAGSYEFKVTTDYGWDNGDYNEYGDAMYGGPNATVVVDEDGSTVTIGFDGTKALIDVTTGGTDVEDTTAADVEDTTAADVEDTTAADVEDTTAADDVVTDGITIRFSNNKFWDAVCVHYWGAEETTWPGVEMTYVETNDMGEDIYEATLPAGTTGIVINNGNNGQQTADVAPENGIGYYCDGDATPYAVGTYEFTTTVVDTTAADVEDTTVADVEDTTAADVEDTTAADVEDTTAADVEDTTAADVEDTTAGGVEDTTAADVEDTTVADVEDTTAVELVGETGIELNGEVKQAQVGDTITYTVELTAEELFENIQAVVTYDAEKLELVRKGDDEVYEEEIACPVLGDAIFNADVEGTVKFNASKVKGYNFKEGGVLVTLDFVVKDTALSSIDLVIEEMTIKGDGTQSYFTGGQAVITDGISVVETLIVPEAESTTTAPVEDDNTTAPADDDTTTAPADDDTTVPTAGTDVQGTTDAATSGDGETVGTGSAAYIYIALAMIAMAACAVVVLRKKVNG